MPINELWRERKRLQPALVGTRLPVYPYATYVVLLVKGFSPKVEETTQVRSRKQSILVVSKDAGLADIRKKSLEDAGYDVINALDYPSMEHACKNDKICLVMIGYSLPPAEKRRAWQLARELCRAPILELYDKGEPSLVESQALFTHQSLAPDDFIDAIRVALKSGRAITG